MWMLAYGEEEGLRYVELGRERKERSADEDEEKVNEESDASGNLSSAPDARTNARTHLNTAVKPQ